MPDFNLDVLLLSEFPGGPGDQLFNVADNLADIIGNASCGIGGIGAAFIGNDFKLIVLTPGLGSGAHSGGIAADHQ
jgi:hypothetical protein